MTTISRLAHRAGTHRENGASHKEDRKPALGFTVNGNPTGWETILLVEDDAAVRTVVKSLLERHGYFVLEAADGTDALAIVVGEQHHIHLVLSDVVMPRMSGRVLLERLRELPKSPRVLMMSGYSEDEIERHGAFPSGTPFMDKPFSMAALTRKVREVLDAGLM